MGVKGYKFNRQKPLDRFIVDFYCKKLDRVIEVDGASHAWEDRPLKDNERQAVLEKLGLKFLRFDDLDVKTKMPFVVNEILHFIEDFEQCIVIINPPSPL